MDKIFLDSGAHSLYKREVMGKVPIDWSYYESDEFWKYVDEYADFIKKNQSLITVYVNVDVIHNSELTWKVQKYLEDHHKLNPMPVFHTGEDFKWFKKYLDNYDYIGVGGLGQEQVKSQWITTMGDPVFSLVCKSPDYLPTHKLHGFAMTSPSLLTRYPWYSVDSTSWIQFGKYGAVVIPRKKMNKYIYSESPYITFVTSREVKKSSQGHFENFVGMHQDYFYDYFEEKGFIIGSSEFKTVPDDYKLQEKEHWCNKKENLVEVIIEEGLSNSHELRDQLNIQFYMDLEASLPSWPWPWIRKSKVRTLF